MGVFPKLDVLQSTHCRSMMEYLCASLRLKRVSEECPRCGDGEGYRRNGKESKTCEWITRTRRRRRRNCKKFDKVTGKNVFEHCRKSCFSASCIDRRDFLFNGQAGQGCEWIADHKEYCVVDDVARACPVTCETECCKDKKDYEFWVKGTKMSCADVRKYKFDTGMEDLCDRRKAANNCKMSCGKCPIEPRGNE